MRLSNFHHLSSILIIALPFVFVPSLKSQSLLGYYPFEDNYDDVSGNDNTAVPTQNPDEVSFTEGFRGRGADINDPAANGGGNTGGSINIPIDANPDVLEEVSFGGWVNLETAAGFPGFMAIDNGGWDRGINLHNLQWSIASGGNTNSGIAPTPGSWEYVVATFSKLENRAILYVGDADTDTTISSTISSSGDGGNAPGELEIEIGRYDNQDLDAVIDDIFIFSGELSAHQVNAIRNLRLSGLDYSPAQAAELFTLFDDDDAGEIAGMTWSPVSGLDPENPGALSGLGDEGIGLVLDDLGNGMATDQFDLDADNDGISDVWEEALVDNLEDLNGNAAGPGPGSGTGDFDGDGLTDLDEYEETKTNPIVADTDEDGLLDGVETNTGTYVSATNTGTDPKNADTDGDGLLDGVETNTGTLVDEEDTGTDPHDADTDGDGYGDGGEIAGGTDPNDENSKGAILAPILYLDFEDNAVDLSGNANDGEVNGDVTFDVEGAESGPTPTTGASFNGGFLNFPGIDMSGIIQDIEGENSYTLSAWIKPSAIDGGRYIFGQTNQGIHNGIRNGGFLHQAHWGADTNGVTNLSTLEGEWIHAAWVYDGDADFGTIYLNGEVDWTGGKRAPNGSGNLLVGAINGGGGADNYLGLVDDVAVWNEALPEVSIQALADGASPIGATQEDGDGDGLPDSWEEKYGVDDPEGDDDNDGLTNIEEFEARTKPDKADTDEDELSDGDEINVHNTNPRNEDSDDDGLVDGFEITAGTDPLESDTDDDGYADGIEIARGTDPNDPLSWPSQPPPGILAYYSFEDNYDDVSGNGNTAVPTQNPNEVSFTEGFRGRGADVNDPAANGGGNTGGTINIPIDANPDVLEEVSFGGWVNLETAEGFPGFMAIDNGGWDRGISLNNLQWSIASGGNTNSGIAPTPGSWEYVVATFSKPENRAVLYVGNADTDTTTTDTIFRDDGGNAPGELEIEIGRYDNQDLDAIVDDIFVFSSELSAHQVNAIRNLRLSDLDLSPLDAAELFGLFADQADGPIADITWVPEAGLDTTNPGEVVDLGGTFTVVLDDQGNGMRTGNPILFEIFSVSRGTDSITFEFNTRPGKIYAVDYSFDLDLWLEVDDGVEATERTTLFTDENPELLEFPKVFYRVREQ